MLRVILITALISISTLLTACVETTHPLCNDTNKVDIPGLAREYTMTFFFGDPDLNLAEGKVTYTQKSKGVYAVKTDENESVFTTCQIAGIDIAETLNGFGTYEQNILTLGQNKILSTNAVLISGSVLKAAGIPFSLVPRPNDPSKSIRMKLRNLREGDDKEYKSLVIDNSGKNSNEVISNNIKPAALAFSIY